MAARTLKHRRDFVGLGSDLAPVISVCSILCFVFVWSVGARARTNSDWSHTGRSNCGRCGHPAVREDGGFEAVTPPCLSVHKFVGHRNLFSTYVVILILTAGSDGVMTRHLNCWFLNVSRFRQFYFNELAR